jgi:hypothetical protein
MIDRSEGDVDRFRPFASDRKGDNLGTDRTEFASVGFVSGADDDPGSFSGEFQQRITEGQDDVVEPVASGQIAARAGCKVKMRESA